VHEALHERAIMLKLAPHLSRPLSIFTPLYKIWEKPYYRTGLKMYDLLAGKTNIGKSRSVSSQEAMKFFPKLKPENLQGGVIYFDGQFDDARMNITLVKTALNRGAVMLNYVAVTSLVHEEGQLAGAQLLDTLTKQHITVSAKCIINATGPFVDAIRTMDDVHAKPMLTVSSGAHVILKQKLCPNDLGFLIPKTDDGRVLFLLPWHEHTLAGTTDQPAEIEFNPKAKQDEISYILHYFSKYFKTDFKNEDILSTWSGLRPLVSNPDANNTAKLSRDHVIVKSKTGLITVTGGKWTTYRKMAQDTLDYAINELAFTPAPCLTKDILLSGASGYQENLSDEISHHYGLEDDISQHLSHTYGSDAIDVAGFAKDGLKTRLHPQHPYIEAEIVYAMKNELAMRASDILCRRTRLAFLDKNAAKSAAPRVIELMQQYYNWDKNKVIEEQNSWADIF